MRPFKSFILNALKLYKKFDISIIASLHGPVLRTNPMSYIQKIFSIFYISSYGNTLKMAKHIAKGADKIRFRCI
ncbi:hypothetical protein [Lebetimonas sp. JH292]|uniref:hypothetical protein n=1 Tax=Lebetimonas sp. JH292 TaxID=990068 RepID=UPI0004652E5B|nr:hypothetical protein [Lebetimonas sp. JH292]